MNLRKAAEQALEALIYNSSYCNTHAEIEALRAALAKCDYPDCVDNGPDSKCTRWLLAECEKSEDYQR